MQIDSRENSLGETMTARGNIGLKIWTYILMICLSYWCFKDMTCYSTYIVRYLLLLNLGGRNLQQLNTVHNYIRAESAAGQPQKFAASKW